MRYLLTVIDVFSKFAWAIPVHSKDVALINISYPHNWTNLDKSYPFLRRQFDTEDELSNFVPDAEKDQQNLYDAITKVNVFIRTWEVDRGAQIPRGNYYISKILEQIESQFHIVYSNKTLNLRIDPSFCLAIPCISARSACH